jgi:hypothetical protein
MDFLSGFPASRGWDCILVVVDYHSKGVRLFPMKKSATAEDVADELLGGVVAVTGPLLSIHSDRGTTFTSNVLRRILHAFGTDLTHTTAWHPQSNDNTEIVNKHLVVALRASLADGSYDVEWANLLPQVQYTLNTTPHVSLGGIAVRG